MLGALLAGCGTRQSPAPPLAAARGRLGHACSLTRSRRDAHGRGGGSPATSPRPRRPVAAIDRWRAAATPRRAPGRRARARRAPAAIYRWLGRRRALSRQVIAALPPGCERGAGQRRRRLELERIISEHVGPPPKIVVRAGRAAGRAALALPARLAALQVGPPLLAAVNFVESASAGCATAASPARAARCSSCPPPGRLRLGGDISDPRDAILGAANYLQANGAPGDESRALSATTRRRTTSTRSHATPAGSAPTERAFYAYYAWQVYVRGKPVEPG